MDEYKFRIMVNWLQSSCMSRGICLERLPPLEKSSAPLGKGWEGGSTAQKALHSEGGGEAPHSEG